jgi:hypothetical protein
VARKGRLFGLYSFWSLFAFSAVIFLLPYEGMLLAFVKMRIVDADHHRPFRVPGGLDLHRRAGPVHRAVHVYPR